MIFTVRLRVTGPNLREHYMARKRRVQRERAAVVGSSLVQCGPDAWEKIKLPAVVTLTRIGARLLDSDNLQGALKAIRDQVAAQLGCGDGPTDPITWRYGQERGEYGVRVEVVSYDEGAAA